MRLKFLKISIFLLFSIGLTACDFLKSKELICMPKADSLVLNEYVLVKIKNWEKEFCVQYWGGKFTCVPFNKAITVFDFYDENTNYIRRANTLKSTVNDQSYAIEISEQWTPQVEVKYSKEDGESVFRFKNSTRKVPRVDLTENEISTFKILTIFDSKYGTTNDVIEGSNSYKLYLDRVLGKSIVWNYRLDRYTKEFTSFGDFSRVYVLNCTEQSSKL
jgi:hypothetical protein